MNDVPSHVRQTQVRDYSAHHSFLHVAELELELAKPGTNGSFNHALVALTMSALAVEALANAIGNRAVPDWEDFESCAPFAKLRLIAERMGLAYANDKEPWGTVRWLCRFRNRLAHAKPERITLTRIVTQEEHAQRSFLPPTSKLEVEITEQNARRAVAAVSNLKYMLCNKLSLSK